MSGWGEATLEGRYHTARAAAHELEVYLVGQDPLRLEDHWQVMSKSSFYRGDAVLATAVAGIDQTLWDIAGKVYGAPVYQLLGGPVRDRVYSWIAGDEPAEIAEHATQMREAGFTAVKMNAAGRLLPIDTCAALDRSIALAAAAREAMGDDGDFALDFHGRFATPMSRRLVRELEPLRPLFVEEPVLPEYTPRGRRDGGAPCSREWAPLARACLAAPRGVVRRVVRRAGHRRQRRRAPADLIAVAVADRAHAAPLRRADRRRR